MRGKWLTLLTVGAALVLGVSASQAAQASGLDQTQAAQGSGLDQTFGRHGLITSALGVGVSDAAAVEIQLGKLVVAGSSYGREAGLSNPALARYTRRGHLDPSFGKHGTVRWKIISGNSGGVWLQALAVQTDGKLLVAGAGGPFGRSRSEAVIARFNANGSIDRSFGKHGLVLTRFGGSAPAAVALALQSDGKIVVAGVRDTGSHTCLGWVDGGSDCRQWVVVRLSTNGRPDPTFGRAGEVTGAFGGYISQATSVAIDRRGRIVVGGYASTATDEQGFALARVLPDGSSDSSFGTDGQVLQPVNGGGALLSLALRGDGKIVAAGGGPSRIGAPYGSIALMRFMPDGGLDPRFAQGGIATTSAGSLAWANDVVLLPHGKATAVGFADVGTGSHTHFHAVVVRYRANGSLDTRFGRGGIAMLRHPRDTAAASAVLQRSGKLVVAGTVAPSSDSSNALLARYLNR